jgi:hypothetical protein
VRWTRSDMTDVRFAMWIADWTRFELVSQRTAGQAVEFPSVEWKTRVCENPSCSRLEKAYELNGARASVSYRPPLAHDAERGG